VGEDGIVPGAEAIAPVVGEFFTGAESLYHLDVLCGVEETDLFDGRRAWLHQQGVVLLEGIVAFQKLVGAA